MNRLGKDSCELIGHAVYPLSVRFGSVVFGSEDNSKRMQRYYHKTDCATESKSLAAQPL